MRRVLVCWLAAGVVGACEPAPVAVPPVSDAAVSQDSLSDGPIRNGDGESGAGAIILKMLEREALTDTLIVVTRWYGGTHLGGDRFAHVVTCVRAALEAWRKPR